MLKEIRRRFLVWGVFRSPFSVQEFVVFTVQVVHMFSIFIVQVVHRSGVLGYITKGLVMKFRERKWSFNNIKSFNHMGNHFDLDDIEFERLFENCELDPAVFCHEAHLRLAWIHIEKYGVEKAIENVQAQLQNFVEHVGAKHKYNKTLTIAAVKAVHHFVLKSRSGDFKEFIAEFPRLKNNFRDLMDFHYGIDIFNSEKAKAEFLEPDLVPFD